MNKQLCTILVCLLLLLSVAASAQTSGTETFENVFANPFFTKALPTASFGPLSISGGAPIRDSVLFGKGTVYASAGIYFDATGTIHFICDGCNNSLVVETSDGQALEQMKFDLIQASATEFNGRTVGYTIEDIADPRHFLNLSLTGPGAKLTVTV